MRQTTARCATRKAILPACSLTLAERFQNVIGEATALPADMAEQHDHYINGTPKR